MQTNKIYCEDCRETMAKMPNNFLDLTVTSPPYDNLRNYKGNVVWNETVWKEILELLFAKTKKGGVVVWVVGDATKNNTETLTSFKQAIFAKEIGFDVETMIFAKQNVLPVNQKSPRYEPCFEFMFVFSKEKPKTFNPIKEVGITFAEGRRVCKNTSQRHKDISNKNGLNGKTLFLKNKVKRTNIWSYALGLGGTTNDQVAFNHSAIFPEKLAADHIYSWSNEGDLVYDPFMGSGTTAKMAHLQNRNWIGSELSQEYVDLAYKRLEPYLAQNKLTF